MSDRIVHWIFDVDMRNNHVGLADLIQKKLKLKIEELPPSQIVMCTNSAWTAVKLVRGGGNVVLHYKAPDGARLNPKAVMRVPLHATGHDIGYKKALTDVIDVEYTSRYGKTDLDR